MDPNDRWCSVSCCTTCGPDTTAAFAGMLALSELEDSRARESSSRARAADGTDDSSAFAAGSRSAAGEGVAAVGTAATASSGASLACCGDAGADDVSAATAGGSHVGVAVSTQAAPDGAVSGEANTVPMGIAVNDVAAPTQAAGSALHFHIRVEAGDSASLRAEWQVRGAGVELASLLAEVGACDYFAALCSAPSPSVKRCCLGLSVQPPHSFASEPWR